MALRSFATPLAGPLAVVYVQHGWVMSGRGIDPYAGVDVRGGSPGTRETDLLRPENTVDRVHALLLSGGSAFGLAAASDVLQQLLVRTPEGVVAAQPL